MFTLAHELVHIWLGQSAVSDTQASELPDHRLERRIHDAGGLTRDELWAAFQSELKRLRAMSKRSGGNFYLTQAARVGKRFARAVVISTLEGQTLHRDAFRLLGLSRLATFRELGHNLGVI